MVFSVVLAAAIIATMRVLGVTLIAAAIVTPAVVARLSTDSFARMLGIATVTGAVCGAIGMYVSYYYDVASGATITLTATALFAVVFTMTQVRHAPATYRQTFPKRSKLDDTARGMPEVGGLAADSARRSTPGVGATGPST